MATLFFQAQNWLDNFLDIPFCLKMADEALSRAGLHFDEINKIRVLEPEVAQQTQELKEECREFVESMTYTNWEIL